MKTSQKIKTLYNQSLISTIYFVMKKVLIMLAIVFGVTISAQARDTYSRNVEDLPKAAQSVIAKNFKANVSLIKIDKTLGRVDDYEVILTDGSEVEFDSKGNWKKVETANNKSVPSAFIVSGIYTYVSKNYKKAKIVGIERERNRYDVELSNGIDLIFDLQGNFLRFDD